MRGELKHLKRNPSMYVGSNVFYDAERETALSYNWWVFVKRINGKLVFNSYRYSSTTQRHQSKVKSLLDSMGIKIDLEIECPKGLDNLQSAIDYYNSKIESLRLEIAKPRTQAKKNEERNALMFKYAMRIEAVIGLMENNN